MTAPAMWLASLAPEKRAAIRALSRVQPWHNLAAPAFLLLWGAACYLVLSFPIWPVRAAGYVIMGGSLHALGILMHEAVHGNFFRNRTADRWAAFLLGTPTLVSASAYRVTHLLHHRHNRGAADPDELGNYTRDRRLLSLLFYVWGAMGMAIFLFHVPIQALRHGTPRERGRVIMEYCLMAAGYGVILWWAAAHHATPIVVHGWLVPLGVVFVMVNVRGWSEHLLTDPHDSLTHTRTITSNAVVRFMLCNLNYHLEHHLFPGIPWYNLPRVHRLLRNDLERAGASFYRSYWRFCWRALVLGIDGRVPDARTKLGIDAAEQVA